MYLLLNKLFYSGTCEFQLTQPFHNQIWSLEITIANNFGLKSLVLARNLPLTHVWPIFECKKRSDNFIQKQFFKKTNQNYKTTKATAKFCKYFVCFLEELEPRRIAS